MRFSSIVLALIVCATAQSVEQAAYMWQKQLTYPAPDLVSSPMAFLLEGGELVTAGTTPDRKGVISILTAGGVERSYVLPGEGTFQIAGLAGTRDGKIIVAGQTSRGIRVLRVSASGEVEFQKEIASSLPPVGLLLQRSGDMNLASQRNLFHLEEPFNLTWSKEPASPISHLLTFQSGNLLIGGADEMGIWLRKFDRSGKELMKVLLPGGPATITHMTLDAASNIVLLGRSPQGGIRLWNLDGATGLVNWSEDKLDQPGLSAAALVTDPNKFILIGINAKEDTGEKGYVVRYSLGGQPITNFNPAEPANRLADLAQDANGEIYVTYTIPSESRTTVHQYRLANNLVGRYNIRTTINRPFEAKQTLVRNADGSIYIVGISGDGATERHTTVLKINQAPIAKHETFAVTAGQDFSSPHSVLANDQYVEGATMRVSQPPKEGKLDFRPDGTFTYTPRSGFTGKDTFRYQLSRGTLSWYAAIVTLEVK